MATDGWVPRVRSALFVPAQRAEFVAKAAHSGADAVILDLEDAVAQPGKPAALGNAEDWLRSRAPGTPPYGCVRINGVTDGVLARDLDAVVHPSLLAVLVPKIRGVDDVAEVAELLSWHEGKRDLPHGSVRIWPIIETAEAVRDAAQIAAASPRIAYMGGGTSEQGDLARSLGFQWTVTGLETLYVRSHVLVAARAAGVQNPVTGLVAGLAQADDVRTFALSSRQLGYAGMMVIHPAHVAPVHDVFTPTDAELREAARMMEALASAGEAGIGAIAYDGRMIDTAMARTAAAFVEDAAGLDR